MMGPGERNRRGKYTRLLAEVSANEVVRDAEDILGEAWLLALTDAEQETATAQRVSTRVRDTAYQLMRSAQADDDTDRINSSYRELAASQQALVRTREQHDSMRTYVGTQRKNWALAAKVRAQAALTDREKLAAAAQAAGIAVDPLHG